MKKETFIEKVQFNGNYKTKKEAIKAIDIVLETIKESLLDKEDENISFTGFGAFKNVIVKGRKGKVPKTNKEYNSKDRKGIKFFISKKFKNLINK